MVENPLITDGTLKRDQDRQNMMAVFIAKTQKI
jgi:hypothetical protein